MNKSIQSTIKNLANKLPDQYEQEYCRVTMTGEEIHLSGLEDNNYPMDDTKYILKIPIYIPVNHDRRLRRAFQQNGVAGIQKYVNRVFP